MNLDAFLDRLGGVRRSGNGYVGRCPSHEDREASLGVTESEGKILLSCYAGCNTADVLDAMGLSFRDLFEDSVDHSSEPEIVYDYTDEDGDVLFQAVRFHGKKFRQRHLENGEWVWNLDGVRRVLYRLPELIEGVREGRTVYIAEGEKDVEALRVLGKVATCNPMGAGKWRPEYSDWLTGVGVIIIADRDEPGRAHAETIKTSLQGKARAVWIVQARQGKDVSDHLSAGLGVEQLAPLRVRVRRGVVTARELAESALEDLELTYRDIPGYTLAEAIPLTFRQGRMYAIGGYTGDGKGLALDTLLPTPDGWTRMKDVGVGDFLLDDTGNSCRVLRVSEVAHRRCYKITFDEGTEIITDDVHRWLTTERRPVKRGAEKVRSTEEIYVRNHKWGHAVRALSPLALPPLRDLEVDPYLLGLWLGDGATRDASISIGEQDIDSLRYLGKPRRGKTCYTITPQGLLAGLRSLGVLGDKHIPRRYLRASFPQRLALAQGLMDSDGYASPRGQCEFLSTKRQLADQTRELLVSLGIKCMVREGRAMLYGKDCGPKYRILFQTSLPVFRLERKLSRLQSKEPGRRLRYMRSVVPVPSVPTKCIEVDSPSHLYLAGEGMIPTHNTRFALQGTRKLCEESVRVGYCSLEMPERDLRNGLLAHRGIPFKTLEEPWRIKGDPEVYVRYQEAVAEIAAWNLDIVFDSGLTSDKVVEMSRDREWDVVFIDHIHRFGWGKERRTLEAEILKLTNLALEQNVMVVILCQLRKQMRGQGALEVYPMPMLADFRETSQIADDSSMALTIWRQRDGQGLTYTGSTQVIVLKNRHTTGPHDQAGHIFFPTFNLETQQLEEAPTIGGQE